MKKVKSDRKAAYHHGNLRRALIDAAVGIVNENGHHALTLRGVAAAANVSRTAPYRHFENKEALMAAVAEEGFVTLNRRLRAVASRVEDPLERIVRQAFEYVRFARGHPAHFEVMFRFNLKSFFRYPSLLEAAAPAGMCLLESVQKCQSAGVVREGDLVRISFGAWISMHGLATLAVGGLVPFDMEGDEALERIVREVAMSHLEGVRKRD